MTEYDGWHQPIKPKGEMMKDIIVEFSGWVRMTPEKVSFVCIGSDKPDINGEEWLALHKDARGDYIIEDVIAAQRDCDDGNYEHVDVFEDDSP
jgi:hypothetical protein